MVYQWINIDFFKVHPLCEFWGQAVSYQHLVTFSVWAASELGLNIDLGVCWVACKTLATLYKHPYYIGDMIAPGFVLALARCLGFCFVDCF